MTDLDKLKTSQDNFEEALKEYLNFNTRCFRLIFKIIVSANIASEEQLQEMIKLIPNLVEIK
jgi:hypothetical protein